MSNLITAKNWYQLDFKLDKSPKVILRNVAQLIDDLKIKKLIDRWFYLFEGKTLRIRFHSGNPGKLNRAIAKVAQKFELTLDPEHPFEPYSEDKDVFVEPETVETFANIMAELSELTIQRTDNKKLFGNYQLVERLSHCIFNNVYGTDTEKYFIFKRLGIDFQSQDNPEQTIVDDDQRFAMTEPAKINLPSIRIPKKP